MIAVDLFFILSGYIMAHTYPAGAQTFTAYRGFLIKRLARLYPVHLLMLLGTVILFIVARKTGHHAPPFDGTLFIRHLTLTHSWWSYVSGYWNAASWSLSAELGAYLLFPLTWALAHRLRTTTGVVTLAGVVLTAYMYALLNWFDAGAGTVLHTGLARSIPCFMLGLLAYRLNVLIQPPRDLPATVSAACTLALVPLMMALDTAGLQPWWAVLLFIPWIWSLSFNEGRFARALSARPLVWLGTISFSLYMVHTPVLMVLYVPAPPESLATRTLPVALAIIVAKLTITLGAAATMHALVEKPARRYLVTRYFSRPQEPCNSRPSRKRQEIDVTAT